MRLVLLVCLVASSSFGAARYFVNGGVNNNWGTTGNWSLTDGGAGGQTVPSAADDVHFTANSPNCTVDSTGRSALSIDFTGYTNTITMSQQITVSGSVTLVSGMTISGAGILLVNGTGTLTSNGKAWPNALTIQGTITATLADNWTVAGLLTLSSTTTLTVINAHQITCTGGLRYGGTSGSASGTTVMLLTASQTVDAPSITSGRLLSPVTIAAGAGTVTFTSPIPIDVGQMMFTSGTVVTGAGTWANATSVTVNKGGGTYIQ